MCDLKVGDIVKWHLAPAHRGRGVIMKVETRDYVRGRNKHFATVFWFGKRDSHTVNFEHLTKVEDNGR